MSSSSGKKALVLWHAGNSTEELQSAIVKIREEWNAKGTEIFIEHVERLVLGQYNRFRQVDIIIISVAAGYSENSFDTVMCGIIPPPSCIHGNDLLEEMIRILKPSGSLLLKEPVITNGN